MRFNDRRGVRMSGWLLIWVLFAAGFFPLGYGIHLCASRKYQQQKDQRRAGVVFCAVGTAMLFPVLWVLLPLVF